MKQTESPIRAMADPEKAAGMSRFFKTGKGEYAEGDQFLGVGNPKVREAVKSRLKAGLPTYAEIEEWLQSGFHEERLYGLLLLVEKARAVRKKKTSAAEDETAEWTFDLPEAVRRVGVEEGLFDVPLACYMAHHARVNNWDLVDLSAPALLGDRIIATELPRETVETLLDAMIEEGDLWLRRIAMVGCLNPIKRGMEHYALHVAAELIETNERHDLMHKAMGWMLREVGKVDERALDAFLERNAGVMPRTALRYAIERKSPEERKRWLSL